MFESKRFKTLHSIISLTAAALLAALVSGCSTSIANRNPINEPFPEVSGEALNGDAWNIPQDLAGKPAIVIMGYVQDAQFDIDRWLLGIVQVETPVPFLELPTIKGMAPRMFKGRIDEGMRGGIPKEDWRGVVTIWGDDAKRVVALTGNEKPNNARVALLDAEGKIAWFADRGFSPGGMLELDRKARELLGEPEETGP